MKNVLAALALAVLAAPAFAGGEAVAQLRGAAADHRAGATSYDGGYAGEESGAIAGRRTPEQLPTLSGVVPTAAVKAPEKAEVPKPDCPPCPDDRPWYKKPLNIGLGAAAVGAAIGVAAAPVAFPLLICAAVGAAYGFFAGFWGGKFAESRGWL